MSDVYEQSCVYGADHPIWWVENILNVKTYTRSRDMIDAIYLYDKVGIWSGHGISKSFTEACIATWWLICQRGWCLITGPKFEQTKDIFFSSLNKILSSSTIPAAASAKLAPDSDKWVLGPQNAITLINSAKHSAVNLQGYHAEKMLLIVDEASGVDNEIFDAVEASQVSRGVGSAKAKMLLAGNPNEVMNKTYFKTIFESGQHVGPGLSSPDPIDPKKWVCMHISSYESPNVTGEVEIPGLVGPEWIEERKEVYGKDSMLFSVRVKGEYFKEGAIDRLFPESLIEAWKRREEPEPFRTRLHWGVLDNHLSCTQGLDPARYGDDATVSTIIENGRIIDIEEKWNLSVPQAALFMVERHYAFGCKRTSLDGTGFGAGVYDDGLLLVNNPESKYYGLLITMVNFANKATLTRYKNIRTQMGFDLRDAVRLGFVILDPALGRIKDKLLEDMAFIGYLTKDIGSMMQKKEDIKKNLGRSPDYFDSAMLAFHAYIRSRALTEGEEASMRLTTAIEKAFGGYAVATF